MAEGAMATKQATWNGLPVALDHDIYGMVPCERECVLKIETCWEYDTTWVICLLCWGMGVNPAPDAPAVDGYCRRDWPARVHLHHPRANGVLGFEDGAYRLSVQEARDRVDPVCDQCKRELSRLDAVAGGGEGDG